MPSGLTSQVRVNYEALLRSLPDGAPHGSWLLASCRRLLIGLRHGSQLPPLPTAPPDTVVPVQPEVVYAVPYAMPMTEEATAAKI